MTGIGWPEVIFTTCLPVITVSAHAMTEDIHKALDRGFDSYHPAGGHPDVPQNHGSSFKKSIARSRNRSLSYPFYFRPPGHAGIITH